ncbi:Response regulator receiver domain-containing protein [Neorhodopirellula lusitana]|uniref:Response regulator receiver domain-containing protein n=1 Tax=Neorhodopirellula lusitana TaxID=445327 RepID=A0ABY1QML0_9BACT|nr:response regulator [Neorhodopirellula lusitana]SMP74232.1 Response regulator receiver domain-containing protein [Neorhodopirellula lusitana]
MSEPLHILTAEDDPDIQFAIAMVLTHAGYRVSDVSNGKDLVRVARQIQPDMILLDLRMPIMNGQEALAILKEEPTTASIPVVVLSASPGDCTSVLDLGAAYFLSKPFDALALLSAVRACSTNLPFPMEAMPVAR